jgi:Asp-tRNA(Asn)/Glu-tRNA(Gln) amidotransferase A subunit family amidase
MPEGGSVPMPIGLQLSAPLFGETLLLGAAHAYERATNHARAHKPQLAEVKA